MATLDQILEFANSVVTYRRERKYEWCRAENACRVVAAWSAIGCGLLDPHTCDEAKATVAALNTLMATAKRASMKDAFRNALDEASIDLADVIVAYEPEAEPAAEEEAA